MKDWFIELTSEYGIACREYNDLFYFIYLPKGNAGNMAEMLYNTLGVDFYRFSSLNKSSLFIHKKDMLGTPDEMIRQSVILLAMECVGL